MSSSSGLLGDVGLSKDGFNKAGGGLISIDDNDDLDLNSQGFSRMWKVYSGQLHGSEPPRDLVQRTVAASTLGTCGISVLFWAWAAQNMATKGGLDLGLFCFAGTFAANAYGWLSSREVDDMYALKLANRFRLAPIAHLVVAATYAFGAWVGTSSSFRVYCALFAGLWCASGVMVRGLAERWYWVVNDRGQEARAGGGSASLSSSGSPLTGGNGMMSSGSSKSSPFADIDHSPSSGLSGGVQGGSGMGGGGSSSGGSSRGAAGYKGIDDDDDEDEAFIAEL